MRIRSFVAALYACSFLVSPVLSQDFTPVVTSGAGDRMDTRGYLGVAWTMGAGAPKRPDVVVGVQRIKITSDDDLTGLDLNARFGLDGSLGRVALSALGGSRNLYANAGVGYDFRQKSMFGTLGAQTARLRVGTDISLHSAKFVPYIELNTLGAVAVSSGGTTLSCAAPGYVLVERDDVPAQSLGLFDGLVSDGLDVDGRLCLGSDFLIIE